jgi:alcohol dehydrogenase
VEGVGAVERLGELAAALGRNALLVTDPGLCAAGHTGRAEASLRAAGVECRRFDAVRENPTTEDVDRCLAAVREGPTDLLIGFGGGSPIDVAKGANLLLAGGGTLEDYCGQGRSAEGALPLIAVPTTAGTGTEVQSFALIARAHDHRKMACGDEHIAPRVALLDSELTLTLPAQVTAVTGLDAIGHAVESLVTTAGGPVSSALARESFTLAAKALPRVLEAPDDLQARSAMLRASCLAGRAIENSMLGAAHSMANPLTQQHDVPHGQAVGMCLPVVVRFNAAEEGAGRAYADLAREAGLCAPSAPDRTAIDALISALQRFVELAGLPSSLAECGLEGTDIDGLARGAADQWTARFNPRSIEARDFASLYREAGAR